jgi:hypothetical protein
VSIPNYLLHPADVKRTGKAFFQSNRLCSFVLSIGGISNCLLSYNVSDSPDGEVEGDFQKMGLISAVKYSIRDILTAVIYTHRHTHTSVSSRYNIMHQYHNLQLISLSLALSFTHNTCVSYWGTYVQVIRSHGISPHGSLVDSTFNLSLFLTHLIHEASFGTFMEQMNQWVNILQTNIDDLVCSKQSDHINWILDLLAGIFFKTIFILLDSNPISCFPILTRDRPSVLVL